MLNWIWLGMLLVAVVVGGLSGRMAAVSDAFVGSARDAVMEVALPLGGMFALMLGLMRLVEKSGLIAVCARLFRPLLRRLFPEVPPEHPAMGAMMLNIAANLVGAGNAATPFGLRAMTELEKLNPRPGTATNAMCTFLVLNTSALTLISTTALLLLKSYGSTYPSAVIGPSILATAAGLVVGLVLVKLCQRLPVFAVEPVEPVESSADVSPPAPPESERAAVATEPPRLAPWKWSVLGAYGVVMAIAFGFLLRQSEAASTGPLQNFLSTLSPMVLPGFAGFLVLYAALAGIRVFEDFVEGARDGMQTVLRIIPYLVGMIVVIGVLRASGVIDMMTNSLRAPLQAVGVPAELVPMALMRPLSGSGSQAVLKDILKNFGADSLISRTAATMYGSSETTFYVLALYFGSVGIRRTRHAVLAGLGADVVAMATSIFLCRVMFGK